MIKKIISILLVITLLLTTGCNSNQTDNTDDKQNTDDYEVELVLKDLPTSWDLTDIYESPEVFEEKMKRVEELLPKYETFRGTLNSVEGILKYLEDEDLLEIREEMDNAMMYSDLIYSLNATDSTASKILARYYEMDQKWERAKAFVDSEIMSMSLEKRQEIINDEALSDYAFWLSEYVDPNRVVLSEETKKALSYLDNAVNSEETHDILDYVEIPKVTFTYPDGSEGVLTAEAYSNIVESKEYDHEFRKEVYMLRNTIRQPYASTYASLLEGRMQYYWGYAQIYGYDSSLEYSLSKYNVDPGVYDKTIEFGRSLLPKVHEYYAAKKKLLGLDEMMVCDLSQSVSNYEPKEVTYEEAANIGRAGISTLGDEYLDVFDEIITSAHVDVYPGETKRAGAFEYLAGTRTTPYLLLNYTGLETYANTIVHEMGHAVYSELSAENQNIYNNNPEIFTQEVASTANEILFYKYKIENAKTKEEKLFWLDQEIEEFFIGAIVRQCLYSEFEDYCYKVIENGGSLDADEMAEKFNELLRLYYGPSVTIPDESGIDWARIHHFYYNYYVYQYASSCTYAASICDQMQENGHEQIDAYINFLKAGNSNDPVSLLKIANVDPLDDKTYEKAGELILNLIDEYIELVNN